MKTIDIIRDELKLEVKETAQYIVFNKVAQSVYILDTNRDLGEHLSVLMDQKELVNEYWNSPIVVTNFRTERSIMVRPVDTASFNETVKLKPQ